MSTMTKIAGMFVVFTLAACDSNNSADNSVEMAKESSQASLPNNIIYFPDGGGVEFSKPFIDEREGPGWKYNDFTLENDWPALSAALKKTMQQQGYEELGSIDLLGFEQSLSFAKKGSPRKVNYRVKVVSAVTGDKILLRVSWNT